jgi:hypothetical protein
MCGMSAKGSQKQTDQHLSYETVAALNQAFGYVLQNLSKLRELGIVRRKLCTALQVALKETIAWTNFEVTERLHDLEQSNWAHYGRKRRAWEKQYEDPNDAQLEALWKSQRKRRRKTKPSAIPKS